MTEYHIGRAVPGLDEPYVPVLIRFEDPPRLEYVTEDVPTIYRRIDDRFALLLDMETREPIGFQYMLPDPPEVTG